MLSGTDFDSHVSGIVYPNAQFEYRKTLLSTYVISGLAMVQVLIFGAVLTFGGGGGMIRRRQKC